MGKPIKQSLTEVEKCAWTAEVYADNAEKWLEEEIVQADGKKHIVAFEPLGVILSIMPWNFPFWQAFRFGIPTLIAGNVSVLKHSNAVPQCALAIEDSFKEAGFPENVFKTVITDHAKGTRMQFYKF
jgi:succinate-semialdehyde dehydrogenase/glutarate-semialdehyde dehydrogenase